jgi:hypothetical protein
VYSLVTCCELVWSWGRGKAETNTDVVSRQETLHPSRGELVCSSTARTRAQITKNDSYFPWSKVYNFSFLVSGFPPWSPAFTLRTFNVMFVVISEADSLFSSYSHYSTNVIVTQIKVCEISGSHGDEYEDESPLGYNAV